MEAYTLGRRIGEGAFGEVVEGVVTATGAAVAVKTLFVRTPTPRERVPDVSREVDAVRRLAHRNVVATLDVVTRGRQVWIVMERLPLDLATLLASRRAPLHESVAKALFRQLAAALAYLHDDAGVMHRDIKPGNVLLAADGTVKVGDFGLTRPLHSASGGAGDSGSGGAGDGTYSSQIGSRWYRAPEVLYGTERYGPAVDMWAAGCILAELVELSPIAPGRTDIDQIRCVHQVLGSPSVAEWPVRSARVPAHAAAARARVTAPQASNERNPPPRPHRSWRRAPTTANCCSRRCHACRCVRVV